MKRTTISKIIKEDKEYYFFLDKEFNLCYEIMDKTCDKMIIHREIIASNVTEFQTFVESIEKIYILFKKDNKLKCVFINNNDINIGNLYYCEDNSFDISEAQMFILEKNIHVLAVLKSSNNINNNVIIHYLYKEGKVESNVICPIINNKKIDRNYRYVLDKKQVNIFYSIYENNNDVIYIRNFRESRWSEPNKLINILGKIKEFDVRYKKNRLYIGIIYKNCSINVLKLIILDNNFQLLVEKTYYNVEELKELNFIDDQNDLFIEWNEKDKNIISSSLLKEEILKAYMLKEEKNIFICEVNEILDSTVYRYKAMGHQSKEDKKVIINVKDLIDNQNQKNIFDYSNSILRILEIQKKRETNVIEQLKFKLNELQRDFNNNQIELKKLTLKYNNKSFMELKKSYEETIINLLSEKEKLEVKFNQLQDKYKQLENNNKNLQKDIKHLKKEKTQIEDRSKKLINEKNDLNRVKKELEIKITNLNNKNMKLQDDINRKSMEYNSDYIELKKELNIKLQECAYMKNKVKIINQKNIDYIETINKYKKMTEKLNKNIEQLRNKNHTLLEKVEDNNLTINKIQELEKNKEMYLSNINRLKNEKQRLQQELKDILRLKDMKLNEYEIKLKRQEQLLTDKSLKNKSMFNRIFNNRT